MIIFGAMMAKVWLGSQTVSAGYEIAKLRVQEKAMSAAHAELLYEVNKAASIGQVARNVARLGLDVLPPGMDEASWELARSLDTSADLTEGATEE